MQAQVESDLLHLACHSDFGHGYTSFDGLLLEDGPLLPSEISALQCKASLVTLSACQSALADMMPGAELSGLVGAFFRAGCPSVVASLWPLADRVALPHDAALLSLAQTRRQLCRCAAECPARGPSRPAIHSPLLLGSVLPLGRRIEPGDWRQMSDQGQDQPTAEYERIVMLPGRTKEATEELLRKLPDIKVFGLLLVSDPSHPINNVIRNRWSELHHLTGNNIALVAFQPPAQWAPSLEDYWREQLGSSFQQTWADWQSGRGLEAGVALDYLDLVREPKLKPSDLTVPRIVHQPRRHDSGDSVGATLGRGQPLQLDNHNP